MSNTVISNTVEQYRQWKRTHSDFPLTVSPNGQWSKKVRGRTYYFGLLSDSDAALKLWLQEKDYLLAGLEPPTYGGGVTVGELCTQHIEDVEGRVAAGKLSPSTLGEYKTVSKVLSKAGVSHTPIRCLTPSHFIDVLRVLEDSGRRLRTQKNIIIKAVFNWGKKMGVYDESVNFGPRFVVPSLTTIEAEQEENGQVRFFDRELILKALGIADAKMKVVILLGINCAFYPSDTEAITYKNLHLDSPIPYHDFRRVKNRRRRMAALWPETVAAIKEYTTHHRPQSEIDNIILSQYGTAYTRRSSGKSLSLIFDALIEKVGERPRGASLGSLRHTYGTIMDLVTDTPMVDLTMGHTSGTVQGQARKSLQRRIYSQFNINELQRLKAVADVVHDWLFDGKFSDSAGDGENHCSDIHSSAP